MSQRVFITGYGIITSIGNNSKENLHSLIEGRCGFGELTILETAHKKDLPCCEIKCNDSELAALGQLRNAKSFTRTTLLGLIALQEAIQSSEFSAKDIRRAGLVSATTTGGIREFEKNFYDLLDLNKDGDFSQFADTANPGEHCERLADHLGIKGYIATVSTACSSSANAIIQGVQLIRNNVLDMAFCGGSEALSKFTINGFNSLMIVDPQHCRPFDNTRKGLNLGEGAAYLVLESEESVNRNRKTPLAEVSGYGNANDAYHQTASSPEGTGALKAMQQALEMAKASPGEIDYINAHGTATENNDLSEGRGIEKLFAGNLPYFSSTKPYTGHTLAAAGGIEAAYCLMALQHQMIWPNLNYQIPMPELSIKPVKELKKGVALHNVLSNSFGFGGNTSSLLLTSV